MARYATYVDNPLVAHNTFRARAEFLRSHPESPDTRGESSLPAFAEAETLLPVPHWEGHPAAEACWEKTWRIALGNLRRPGPATGFVSSFIDPAFNGNLFMWDSAFILMFARYGRRVFDFQKTLDNFYARQHSDGFICREIQESDGADAFDRFDPDATGPNLLPWAEWTHYAHTADADRLRAVLPPLLAYHRWFRTWRTWPDGTYWATGWACGMDNQPRMSPGNVAEHNHGHMSWVDTSLQQVLSARCLVSMNEAAGNPWPDGDLREEAASLSALVNDRMWDEQVGFYCDRWPDGRLSQVKSIGAYWALLAGVVPPLRVERFVGHLEDPASFNRPHRVPSLGADHPAYRPGGDYWRGSVWAPTNYMVLRGLRRSGRDALAHEIALNHLSHVLGVFQKTGTLWENYAPESTSRGEQSARDFVGWTGLPPVAVLLEHVFGLEPDAPRNTLSWDVRLTEGHGVSRYPFGAAGVLELACARRGSPREAPSISASSNVPLTLDLRWENGARSLRVEPGREVVTGGQ